MALDIPVIDNSPRLISFAPTEPMGCFPIFPGEGPAKLMLVSNKETIIRETDWFDVNLDEAAHFIHPGSTFSVHTRRVLGLLAHWRALRDPRGNGYDLQRAFLSTRDLCEAFYGSEMIITFEERRHFCLRGVCKALGLPWENISAYPNLPEKAAEVLYTLCQRLHHFAR